MGSYRVQEESEKHDTHQRNKIKLQKLTTEMEIYILSGKNNNNKKVIVLKKFSEQKETKMIKWN